jgi:hypothetical protein
MASDQFHEHLNKLVYSGVRRERIEAEIEEHVESPDARMLAFGLLEEFFVDLELAKQARAKVRDNFLVATTVFLAGLGVSTYTFFSVGGGFLLVYLAMIIAAWYAAQQLIQLQKPLEIFSPRMNKETRRLIRRKL